MKNPDRPLLPSLVEILRAYLPLNALIVLRRDKDDLHLNPVAWSVSPDLPEEKLCRAFSGQEIFERLCGLQDQPDATAGALRACLPGPLQGFSGHGMASGTKTDGRWALRFSAARRMTNLGMPNSAAVWNCSPHCWVFQRRSEPTALTKPSITVFSMPPWTG